jgi:hypothetical protein
MYVIIERSVKEGIVKAEKMMYFLWGSGPDVWKKAEINTVWRGWVLLLSQKSSEASKTSRVPRTWQTWQDIRAMKDVMDIEMSQSSRSSQTSQTAHLLRTSQSSGRKRRAPQISQSSRSSRPSYDIPVMKFSFNIMDIAASRRQVPSLYPHYWR